VTVEKRLGQWAAVSLFLLNSKHAGIATKYEKIGRATRKMLLE
jgi:hypothetical protein